MSVPEVGLKDRRLERHGEGERTGIGQHRFLLHSPALHRLPRGLPLLIHHFRALPKKAVTRQAIEGAVMEEDGGSDAWSVIRKLEEELQEEQALREALEDSCTEEQVPKTLLQAACAHKRACALAAFSCRAGRSVAGMWNDAASMQGILKQTPLTGGVQPPGGAA